jgi:putative membrane-bound dehydrogenase-like protein
MTMQLRHGRTCVGSAALVALLAVMHQSTAVAAPPADAPTVETDYAADLPRLPQVSAAVARDTLVVAPGFALELMAAEPLVASPVAIAWDEDGALFVAEMRGYSEHQGERIGRIRLLHDEDGDGRPDRATVYAEGLAWPTAVCCWDGGVFVGDAPDILWLRDADGDGVADERRVVFTGFGTTNVQGLINSFAFGLDGRIYGSASSTGGNVRRVGSDGQAVGETVKLAGRDFSFDPRMLDLRAETGGAQHGRSCDDAGHAYVCSNSNHAIRCMIEDRFLGRNAAFTPPSGQESIAVDGPQAEVFRLSPVEPWRVLRTRLRASGLVPGVVEGGGRPAGYFTSATGITIVRGDHCGDLAGMLVVGDVGSNLVHRKRIVRDGAGVRAERVDEKSELVASRDTWFRPVQFANAPDGGLWIIDMQREVIEHPASLPPPIKKHIDLTSGRDSGRLWRLAAAPAERRSAPRLASATSDALVAFLSHPNGWHRDTAHRLLLTRRDMAAVPALRRVVLDEPATSAPDAPTTDLGRQHAAFVLASLGGLESGHVVACLASASPIVRSTGVRLVESLSLAGRLTAPLIERLVVLAADEPDVDVRFRLALVAGGLPSEPRHAVLSALLARDGADAWCRTAAFTSLSGDGATAIVREWLAAGPDGLGVSMRTVLPGLFAQIARRGDPAAWSTAVEAIAALMAAAHELEDRLVAVELLADLDAAIAAGGGSLPDVDPRARALGAEVFEAARQMAHDRSLPPAARARAARGLLLAAEGLQDLVSLASADEPPPVVISAIDTLGRSRMPAAIDALVAGLATGSREHAARMVESLLRDGSRATRLLNAVADRTIDAALLDRQQANALWRFPDAAVRQRAVEVLGAPPPADRTPLVEAYRASLPMQGNAAAGKAIFTAQCSGCHRVEGVGRELAPNLVAMQSRGADAILLGVLDPNREVLPAFVAHTAVTDDGRVLTGIVAAQSETSVTLRAADGTDHLLPRDEIDSLSSTGRSLMPEGFERAVDPKGMADLLAYLMSAR